MNFYDVFNKDDDFEWKELITFTQYANSIPELIHLEYAVTTGMIHVRERDNKVIDQEIYDAVNEVLLSFVNRPATVTIMDEMKYAVRSKLERFACEGSIKF